jgi:enoyl-CoA hydratase
MPNLTIARRDAATVITLPCVEATIDIFVPISSALHDLGRDPMTYGVVIRSGQPVVGGHSDDQSGAKRTLPGARAPSRSEQRAIYDLCWQIECFSKPIVSLLDGSITGALAGLALYGTHRVAGPAYVFCAAGSVIEAVPDCGLSYALARMPHGIGLYLALTGRTIERDDAYALGLVTHCIAAERYEEIEALIAAAEPLDPVLDDRHEEPIQGSVMRSRKTIERFFAASESVEQIFDRLRAAAGQDKEWADSVLADLAKRPLPEHRLTIEALRRAAALDIEGVLAQDFRVSWHLAGLAQVPGGISFNSASLEGLFASLGADELHLLPRSQMQAGRGISA